MIEKLLNSIAPVWDCVCAKRRWFSGASALLQKRPVLSNVLAGSGAFALVLSTGLALLAASITSEFEIGPDSAYAAPAPREFVRLQVERENPVLRMMGERVRPGPEPVAEEVAFAPLTPAQMAQVEMMLDGGPNFQPMSLRLSDERRAHRDSDGVRRELDGHAPLHGAQANDAMAADEPLFGLY